jgi:hypothetical protein
MAASAAAVASTAPPQPLRPRRGIAVPSSYSHRAATRPRLAVSASSTTTGTTETTSERGGAERFYFNFTGFPFPLGPFLNRRTIRTEVINPA